MTHLLFIFTEIILPIIILIALGIVIQRKFHLDLATLAKINIYYLSPALIFIKLYESAFSLSLFLAVVLFCLLFVGVMYIVSTLTAKVFKLEKPQQLSFTNSVIFYNSGNYGIPVNDLVFKHDSLAMAIQITVMAFQNTLLFSYGVVAMNSLNSGKWKALLGYFKMPLFYALCFGIIFNLFNVAVPNFLLTPITYISNSLIAIALLTLGAQIAQLKLSLTYIPLYFSIIYRLLIGPLIALLGLLLFQIDGLIAQALLISTAMPTSVNSSIVAQEYKNDPEFAAQSVLLSTLLSSLTVTFVIFIAFKIF